MLSDFNGEIVIQKSLEFTGDSGATPVTVIGGTAKALSELFGEGIPPGTRFVTLTASGNIRFTSGGVFDPTTSLGHQVTTDQMPYWFDSANLADIKIIGVGGNVDVYAEAWG
jgi:hypothetical protein